MNDPCKSCPLHTECAFSFGFFECEEYLRWLNTPMSGQEKAEAEAEEQRPHINEEWAEHIRKRFERVE